MDSSIAHPGESTSHWDVTGWKAAASHVSAVLIGLLFVVAGVWKITDPFSAAVRMTQALVPGSLSLPAAVGFGVAELLGGVLIIVPRFRRWGAWITGALLVAFMIYIALFYNQLRGEECNCFPWVKRAVGPAFFIGDAVMLALAAIAGWWSRHSSGLRTALLILLASAVFAGVSFGMAAVRSASIQAPAVIEVEGRPFALREGRVFLYFFNPECAHCATAAREMSGYAWGDVRLIAVATEQQQFARDFLKETGLQAKLSTDAARLRKAFSFVATPYAVALENGRMISDFRHFEGSEPLATLRRAGFAR